MKKIVFYLIAIAILSMFAGCSNSGSTIAGNTTTLPGPQYTYRVNANIQTQNRDLPPLPIGTEIFISGHITALDKTSGIMLGLNDTGPINPGDPDRASCGFVDSLNTIQAVVRLRRGDYGISFSALLPNGDTRRLYTTPTVWVSNGVDSTEVDLNKLYQPRLLINGVNKAFQPQHGFTVADEGDLYAYGDFLVEDLQIQRITWNGQGHWTSNEAGTQIIPVPDSLLALYAEAINSSMDMKIKLSNNNYYEDSMTLCADSLCFEYYTMYLPGMNTMPENDRDVFYGNLKIYESGNEGTIKLFGINVGNTELMTELMNIYSFWGEDLFSYQIINNVVSNIQTLDLRGVLAIIVP